MPNDTTVAQVVNSVEILVTRFPDRETDAPDPACRIGDGSRANKSKITRRTRKVERVIALTL